MSAAARAARIGPERFQRLYERSEDPWDYDTSDYEREKYANTLALLPGARVGRALEVGCSIGVFTAQLAQRCEQVVALDFAPLALASARRRLDAVENVHLLQASFPEQAPAGPWDLVLCSEVLYYLDRRSLILATSWLREQLEGGASVIAVSWRGTGVDEPWKGDEVHDMLACELARWHSFDRRRRDYRLDRFDPR